jgi:hypothetical protein
MIGVHACMIHISKAATHTIIVEVNATCGEYSTLLYTLTEWSYVWKTLIFKHVTNQGYKERSYAAHIHSQEFSSVSLGPKQ